MNTGPEIMVLFCSLSMGLCNSPDTSQCVLDLVLRGLTWVSVLVYMDYIVVYAQSYDLNTRLEEVFFCLKGANLLFERCKIADMVRWHMPKSVHELQQFLGLCRYYFIHLFIYFIFVIPFS